MQFHFTPQRLSVAGELADLHSAPDFQVSAGVLEDTAQESMRVNPAAREQLRRLCAAYDTSAGLSAVINDRITLLEPVEPPGVRVGQSYPFAPPVGLMFVLWDEQALRDWLAKSFDRTASHRFAAPRPRDRRVPGERLSRRAPHSGGATAVFADGGVASLHVGRELTDDEIAHQARGLIEAADAVTAQLGGGAPS